MPVPVNRESPDTVDPTAWPETLNWQAPEAASTSGADSGAGRQETTCAEQRAPRPEPKGVAGYEVLGELGRGGMGVVYKARQLTLKRLVALKMILAGAHAGPEQVARFRSEAEAIARLDHPNLVRIYDVGQDEGRPYFSMEFVDGSNLDRKIDGKPQSPRLAAELVETLARAMHAAHDKGIVHRDLKPANVLLTGAGVPKITDFGLAKRVQSEGLADEAGASVSACPTLSGTIMGTPSYMAPEQAASRNKEIGPLSDVYALGAILYEMLTGRPPFQAETAWDTIVQVISIEPVAPSRLQPKVPRDLETICLKCLEKEPRKRYASAEALAEDLQRFQTSEPILARPASHFERAVKWTRRRPAVAALLFVTFLVTVALVVGAALYNAWLQSALAESRARTEESRQRLVRLYVADGSRHMDEGDYFGSLVWFAGALQLDAGDPSREEVHRIRLGAVLSRCPELLQLWGHDAAVRCARYSSDGRLVVTASADGAARIWDATTGQQATAALHHDGPVVDAAFSHDGRYVVTASADHTARVWDVKTGVASVPPLKHGAAVTHATFSPDDRWILSACDDNRGRIWNARTGSLLSPTLEHAGAVTAAAFSPDGQWIVTASADHTAQVWQATTRRPATVPLRSGGPVVHASFSPDGRWVVTASQDQTARVWNAATGEPRIPPLKHARTVNHAWFSPDSRCVVTSSFDHTARIWNAATGELLAPPLNHGSNVFDAVFSPDGSLLATASDDNTARVWDAQSGEPRSIPLRLNGNVASVAFSPSGRYLLTSGDEGMTREWNVTTASADGQRVENMAPPEPARVSPNGRLTLEIEGTAVHIIDLATRQALGPPLKHVAAVRFALFSPDGRSIVTTGDDNMARVWNAATGELLCPPVRHPGSVLYAAFDPGGKFLATAGEDQTVRVWDAHTGEPLMPPLKQSNDVRCVWFGADGRRVYASDNNQQTRGWALPRDDRPVADLLMLAHLLGSNQIDRRGGLIPIETSTVQTLWQDLRSRYPGSLLQP